MREDGRIARLLRDKDHVEYRHLRFRRGGAVTVAFRKAQPPADEGVLQMAFSFCNPKDQFSRADGRARSLIRLLRRGGIRMGHERFRVAVKVRISLEDTLFAGLSALRKRKRLPTWLVRQFEKEIGGEGLAAQAQ